MFVRIRAAIKTIVYGTRFGWCHIHIKNYIYICIKTENENSHCIDLNMFLSLFFQKYSTIHSYFRANYNSFICFYELFVFDCFNPIWNDPFKSRSRWIRNTDIWFICIFDSTGRVIGLCLPFLCSHPRESTFWKSFYLLLCRQRLDVPSVFSSALHDFVSLLAGRDTFWRQCHIFIMIGWLLGQRLLYRYIHFNRRSLKKSISQLHFDFQGLISLIFVCMGNVHQLIEFASFLIWVFYGAAVICLLVLRKTQPNLPRPYKVPLVVAYLTLG